MDGKQTILAIDDNNVNLVMLKAMLSEEYNVETLTDALKAEETAKTMQPSLILMDIYMQGMDGSAICRSLKSNAETAYIPIIIVSGHRDGNDITNGLEAGADDYVAKPFSTKELKLRIKRRIESGSGLLQQKIRTYEREIASYYKYSANGIITVSPHLEIRRYNRRFLELFGITLRDNHNGKQLGSLISGEPMQKIMELTSKVGKPPIFETAHISLRNPDGSKTFIDATASRLSASEDDGILLVFTDVTKLTNMDSAILNAAVAAEERERKNLAQELHDGIGATLSSINIYMNLILSGGTDVDEFFRNIRLTKELVTQTIDGVKEIANNLHPVILTRFGLVATISNIIEGLEQSRLIQFNFDHSKYTDIKDKDLELSLYRIINELINNTLKYAEAKNVSLIMERGASNIWLQYSDDGKGFDTQPDSITVQGSGMGIGNIFGRIKGFNGICNLQAQPGHGMSMEIEIPYRENGTLATYQ